MRRGFERIGWVSVGQTPVVMEMQRVLYQQLTGEPMPSKDGATAATQLEELRAVCTGKRWLVVLDDVWDKAHANIVERAEAGKIPLDISVKLGQCLLYEGRTDEGLKQIFELLGHDVSEFDDLFFDGGNTMMEVGLPSKAEILFRELLTVEEYDNIDIWQRIETCIQQSKGNQGVIEFYESLHDKHPSDVFVAVSLADALSNVQDDEECARRASSLISNLDEVEVQNYGIFLRVTALQRKLLTKDELMVLIPSALKLMADLIEKRSLRKLQRTSKAGEDFVERPRDPRRPLHQRGGALVPDGRLCLASRVWPVDGRGDAF